MHRAEQESHKTTSREDGGLGVFSLRGLLIAIVVCAVCALGFSTVLSAIHNRSVQQQVITATELARDRLEQIKRAAYDTVITANYPEEPEMMPYIVQRRDTLGRIASRHRCVSLQELAEINNIRPPKYMIRIGQQLKIPSCK